MAFDTLKFSKRLQEAGVPAVLADAEVSAPAEALAGTGRQKSGNLHRENAPAVEYPDGTKEWWRNGMLHRDDGPAVVELAVSGKEGGRRWASRSKTRFSNI